MNDTQQIQYLRVDDLFTDPQSTTILQDVMTEREKEHIVIQTSIDCQKEAYRIQFGLQKT